MIEVSKELKSSIVAVNEELKRKLMEHSGMEKDFFRRMINLRIDKIFSAASFDKIIIDEKYAERGMAGVDGSVACEGADFPNYIAFLQAGAKSTKKETKAIIEAGIHSPLLELKGFEEDEMSQEKDERILSEKLAQMELRVAKKALEKFNPAIILIDGPLTRYMNANAEEWECFKQAALKNQTAVIGVIEEIKSYELARRLAGLLTEEQETLYDRELLFGMLDVNEMFILKGWEKGGIKKGFIRASNDPQATGIEFLKEQEKDLQENMGLVLSITPKDGRGIPLWLDIIDSEIRISKKISKALIETHIDSEVRYKLFSGKREKRIY